MESNNTEDFDPKWGEPSEFHEPRVLASFQTRQSDVLIATPPKAGTTWMQQILHQLRSGGDSLFDDIDNVVPWLEIPRQDKSWQTTISEFDKLENPRIFKTHCTYDQMPGVDIAKIILTTRDPRDCCLSFYHHLMDISDTGISRSGITQPTSIDEHVDNWLEFSAWYRNIKSWWPHRDNKNILILRYEDLKQDFNTEIDKILTFLNWEITTDQRQIIVENCSFDWMKKNVHRFNRQGKSKDSLFKPDGFVKKGKIGEGKKVLTEEQQNKIINKAKETLDDDCLKFLDIDV